MKCIPMIYYVQNFILAKSADNVVAFFLFILNQIICLIHLIFFHSKIRTNNDIWQDKRQILLSVVREKVFLVKNLNCFVSWIQNVIEYLPKGNFGRILAQNLVLIENNKRKIMVIFKLTHL